MAGARHTFELGSYRRRCEAAALLLLPLPVAYLLSQLFWRDAEYHQLKVICAVYVLLRMTILVAAGRGISEASASTDWLAYGSAEGDGIYFRKWLRRRFVRWKGIERLEYWPDRGGRIDLYLYSQPWPVVFLPGPVRRENGTKVPAWKPGTLDYISRKLAEAWPGKSAFVLCYQGPQKKRVLFALLRDLNPQWESLAVTGAILLLTAAGRLVEQDLLWFLAPAFVYPVILLQSLRSQSSLTATYSSLERENQNQATQRPQLRP